MLRLKVTPIVGLPQFTGWSQVAESTASVSVRLIVVYAISGKHAGNVGRDISEKVADFYYYDAQQFHEFLQQLVSYAHTNECKMYFSCAVLGKQKSIFATYGGSIFLKRGEKSGKILTSDYEVKIVEGNYLPDDVFVLTTLQADQFLSEIQLKFQQGYDTDIIITSVVPGLHAQEDSSLSALVFINKDEDNTELLEQLKESETPFIAIEDEAALEDEASSKANNGYEEAFSQNVEGEPGYSDSYTENGTDDSSFPSGVSTSSTVGAEKQGLAEIQVEVGSVETPRFLQKVSSTMEPVFGMLQKKGFLILRWLVRFLKRLILRLWLFFRSVDFSQMLVTVKHIKSKGLQSVLKKQKVSESELRPRRSKVKLLVVIGIVFLSLAVIGIFKYQRNVEVERIQALLVPIQAEVVVAQQQAVSDPISARMLVNQAIEKITQLEEEQEKSSARNLITTEKQSILTYLQSISGREELQDLGAFYDLRLAKSDFIASGIDIFETSLLVYDKELRQVLLLDIDSKKVAVRDFSDRADFDSAVLLDGFTYVLSDGVYKYENSFDEQAELEVVREVGDSNKVATLLDAYDRYVYVINPEKRNIFRYAQTDEGYSEPVGWMKSATGVQYDDILTIAVDGDVWLTTNDGQVKKFTSGREETLSLRGLEIPFSSDIYAYTNENLEKLYVLDPSNNRIVFFEKDGTFVKEIKSVSFGAANGLAVSEALGRIFVISGSVVYEVGL